MDDINPKSLLATHPEVAKEWNFGRNKNLTSADVTKGMRKKVWWKCDKGSDHEWEAMIYSKSSGGSKCPCCNGKKLSISNRLDNLFPEIVQEWNYDKNELGPDRYTSASNKKVWWKCSKDHEWISTISNRTNKDTRRGCPYCSRKKPSEINRLDLHGSEKILKEWHPKNKGNPCDYSIGTQKKVWWKCSKNHEWESRIADRAGSRHRNCPYCTRQRPSEINRLDIHAPQLLEEWSTKNEEGPEKYSVGSDKKAWWVCSKGHEWSAAIHNRVKGSGCPFCAGQKVTELNRFDIHAPQLLKEWSTKNKECPEKYSVGSSKKAWWVCSKGHEWDAIISDRIRGKGCPYCSGRYPSETNRLDLHGPKDILDEWSSKNKKGMENYSIGTDKKVWWVCSKGHEWNVGIGDRVRHKSGCPVCKESSGERSIRLWLEKNKIEFKSQVQLNPCRRWKYDFYLPDHNIAIEYDGRQHFTLVSCFHKSQSEFEERQKIDLAKTKYCAFHGISLIRINYRYFDEIEDRMEKAINYRKSDKEVLYYFTGVEYDDHEKVFNENLRPL